MLTEEDTLAGLLDWINSLRVSGSINTVDEVKSGTTIWEVLQQIDRLSFPGTLPEESDGTKWVKDWTNLKHVYDALSIFLVEECDQRLPLPGGRPDLKAIAQNASVPDTIILLKLVVVAAINCADRLNYLEKMQSLSILTQEVLMTTAQEAGEDEVTESEEHEQEPMKQKDNPERKHVPIDNDLASEERLGKVIADNQRMAHENRDLQKQLDDTYDRYSKLQQRHDGTVDELRETRERLAAVLAGKEELGLHNAVDKKHEAVIATLEARITSMEVDSEKLMMSNEVLRIKAEKVQKLQDEYDEIKIERDKLSRKANAADKYKQKLESSQEIERENAALRGRILDLQGQLKQSDTSRLTAADLQREIDEYRRLLPSIEQERHELGEMKKRLEFDYHTLEARHQDVLEQNVRQRGAIEELEGRLQDYEGGRTPTTPRANGNQNSVRLVDGLDDEQESTSHKDAGTDRDLFDGVSEAELQAIMSAMRAQAELGTATGQVLSRNAEQEIATVIAEVRKQSALIVSLEARLEAAECEGPKSKLTALVDPHLPSKSEQAAHDTRLSEVLQINENLSRELRLMSSAWYEQNLRIMGRNTTMMRARSGREPKSFLGQQRKMVEDVMLGRRSGQG